MIESIFWFVIGFACGVVTILLDRLIFIVFLQKGVKP